MTTTTTTATTTATTTTAGAKTTAAGAFTDHHATQHDRLGLLAHRRRKAFDDFLRNLALDEPFDVTQEAVFVGAHK